MSAHDLEQLEDDIKLLREQLAGKRRVSVMIAPEEQVRIDQQIIQLRKRIRGFEQEKWQLIAEMTADLAIADDEAEVIIAEIVTEGEAISATPPEEISAEILALLQKIITKLNEPSKPAAAKLKGAISALPPFVSLSYEAELDTESAFQSYFPTFNRIRKGLIDRLKK